MMRSFLIASLCVGVGVAQSHPELTGRVVDANGAPAAGAKVRAEPRPLRRNGGPARPPLRYRLRVTEAEAASEFGAVCAADGTFRIAGPHVPASCDLIVDAGADRPPAIYERARVGAPPPTVALRRGVALFGVVRDAEGRPVAGARVTADVFEGHGELVVEARTDAEGRYRIEGLPGGSGWPRPVAARTTVQADGLVRKGFSTSGHWEADGGAIAMRCDHSMDRGAYVEGRIAAPPPGRDCRVFAWTLVAPKIRLDDLTRASYFEAFLQDAVRVDARGAVGADGSFRIGPVGWIDHAAWDIGRTDVGVAAVGPDGASAVSEIVRGGEKSGWTTGGEPLPWNRVATVRGRVLRADGGPATDVVVTHDAGLAAFGVASRFTGDAEVLDGLGAVPTAADGRFELVGVPVDATTPPAVRVVAWSRDGWTRSYELKAPVEGDAAVVALTMPPENERTPELPAGVVVDASGRPIAGATVALVSRAAPWPGTVVERVAGADGAFVMPRIWRALKGDEELLVVARGYSPTRLEGPFGASDSDETAAAAARARVAAFDGRVVLNPSRTVRGFLRDAAGIPLAGARLYASFAESSTTDVWSVDDACRAFVLDETTSGPDGAFRLEDVPHQGALVVVVPSDRAARAFLPPSDSRRYDLRPGPFRKAFVSVDPDGVAIVTLKAVPEEPRPPRADAPEATAILVLSVMAPIVLGAAMSAAFFWLGYRRYVRSRRETGTAGVSRAQNP